MASLNDRLKVQVKKVFAKALKDGFAELVVYNAVTVGAYDTATDTRTVTTETVENLPAVPVGLSKQEVDYFPANRRTVKLLISALDLGTLVPKETDYVLISGTRWDVKRVKEVPGMSLWTLYLQEP